MALEDDGHDIELWGEGQLAHCRTCGGAEGSIPSECPGRRMTIPEEDRAYAGGLDFVGGAWALRATKGLMIRMSNGYLPGCPMGAVSRW